MRAVLCREFGPYENLKLEEVPPPALPETGVRIATRAAGVSFATSLIVTGRYQRKPPLPFVPGTEVAGIVTETGPGVTHVQPGDRVLASIDWGGQAEEAVALADGVHPMPDGMGFVEATTFPVSYATSYAALVWKANLAEGETLLVHGAAGAVGLAAVEIGKALGAEVIATASTAEKLELARAHGADHAVNYTNQDLAPTVKFLTRDRGADVVFDPVGGEVTLASLRCLAREGRLLTIGYAGGTIPEIPANLLLVKNLSVIGLNYGTYLGWSPGDNRALYAPRVAELQHRLAELYTAGHLRPFVSHRFRLDDFQAAMQTVLARRALGKVVLEMGGD